MFMIEASSPDGTNRGLIIGNSVAEVAKSWAAYGGQATFLHDRLLWQECMGILSGTIRFPQSLHLAARHAATEQVRAAIGLMLGVDVEHIDYAWIYHGDWNACDSLERVANEYRLSTDVISVTSIKVHNIVGTESSAPMTHIMAEFEALGRIHVFTYSQTRQPRPKSSWHTLAQFAIPRAVIAQHFARSIDHSGTDDLRISTETAQMLACDYISNRLAANRDCTINDLYNEAHEYIKRVLEVYL